MYQSSPFQYTRITEILEPGFNIKYLKLLSDISRYRYDSKIKRAKLFLRNILYLKATVKWYQYIAQSPLFIDLLRKQKSLIDKPFKNYLRIGLTVNERIACIISSHDILVNRFNEDFVRNVIYKDGIKMSSITLSHNNDFEIIFGIVDDECKEGELSISLYSSDREILSIIRFSLLPSTHGVTLYIGCIQGPKGNDSRDQVKKACKLLSGLSPNRVVLESCLAFAKHVLADQVLMVCDKNQVFKRKQNKHFSYDVFCNELGALLNNEGDYIIPLFIDRKKKEDTPTKRRAKYRRQHEILDNIYSKSLASLKQAH